MLPTCDEQDDEPSAWLFLQTLGVAIRHSFEATLDEPLPAEMGLLLMRLALTEVLKDAAEQEAQAEPKLSAKAWAEAFERSMESSARSKTWRRAGERAGG